MMIDATQQINSVRRHVANRTLEAGEGRSCTISQTYDTSIDDLWDTCTNPERLPRWFLPVTGDLRENGHFQLEGNAGGTISRCEPPTGLSATWEFDGSVSWIEVRFTAESKARTRFELEHIMHVDDHWREYGPAATGVGWEGAADEPSTT